MSDDSEFEKIVSGLEPDGAEDELPRFDPVTGERVSALDLLNAAIRSQGGKARFVRVRQVGRQNARWYLTVATEGGGEPTELTSLTTKALRNLSNLAERVMEAGGGEMPTPRAGSDKHAVLMNAIQRAKEFEEHGATEEGLWRQRLASYLRVHEPGIRELNEPKQRLRAATDSDPFVADRRLYVSSGHWLEFLTHRRTRDVELPAVASALRQMGFDNPTAAQIQVREKGKVVSQRYWVSPPDFDWGDSA